MPSLEGLLNPRCAFSGRSRGGWVGAGERRAGVSPVNQVGPGAARKGARGVSRRIWEWSERDSCKFTVEVLGIPCASLEFPCMSLGGLLGLWCTCAAVHVSRICQAHALALAATHGAKCCQALVLAALRTCFRNPFFLACIFQGCAKL